jgi:hypothetical protein
MKNSQTESVIKNGEIVLCYCGYPENPHNFRHKYDPQIYIEKWRDEKGDFFKIKADNFSSKKIEGRCKFPQCGAVKNLHGPIIKHEFDPSNDMFQRTIKFKIPLNTTCRYIEKTLQIEDDDKGSSETLVENICGSTVQDHSSGTHAFTTLVHVEGRTEHDIVTIIGKNTEQTIIWETNR